MKLYLMPLLLQISKPNIIVCLYSTWNQAYCSQANTIDSHSNIQYSGIYNIVEMWNTINKDKLKVWQFDFNKQL
jgi:hypothetical protein